MTLIKIAAGLLIVAFVPVAAAWCGFDLLPHWVGAWCFIIGYPAALLTLIAAMGACDER